VRRPVKYAEVKREERKDKDIESDPHGNGIHARLQHVGVSDSRTAARRGAPFVLLLPASWESACFDRE
jgi:hypothetical protein